jgi:carbon storage regulator
MLVLSRKPMDSIVIGNEIRISVIKIDRNHVRLGIEAPGHISIVRSELLEPSPARSSVAHDAAACLAATS